MIILFSPSESKNKTNTQKPINKNSFIFKHMFYARMEALKKYQNFVNTRNTQELEKFFGVKDLNEINELSQDLSKKNTIKAIERYSGVAFEYLNYPSLNSLEKKYIDNNVIIFSNLFGPILAKDLIPYYKFKQGEKIENFNIEKFYKEKFSKELDDLLENELIIDLRAKFYEKFYTIKKPFLTFAFLKNSKALSHFAKAYRGKILRVLANKNIHNKEALLENLPDELKIKEIKIQGLKEEIILDIVS
ncbi:YaaA family protein [Campylobacter armoricus]|uniref:YaaA family protein n=1 Tax=Campylobacter armoricus TaxID=2505970 RepID=UPI001116EB2F|nr:YaaA family protein [Campylobacter armoricus]